MEISSQHKDAPLSHVASSKEAAKLPTVELDDVARELAQHDAIIKAALAELPSITDIVVTTDRVKRAEMRQTVAVCDRLIDAEPECTRNFLLSDAHKYDDRIKNRTDQLIELRLSLTDLKKRVSELFVGRGDFPVSVTVLAKEQTAQLLESFHRYRDAFWKQLYEVPAVQQYALNKLRRVIDEGYAPSLVVHHGSIVASDEEKLRERIGLNIRTAQRLLTQEGLVPKSEVRAKVAEILVQVALDPEELNGQLRILRSKANELADIEIALTCAHKDIRPGEAQSDPRCATWRELSKDFGGGAVVARAQVAELERLQEPYIRIRQYLTTANIRFVRLKIGAQLRFKKDRDDIVQEGAIGLTRAIEKFDRHSGFQLITYASWWISQMAVKGLERSANVIAIPGRFHAPIAMLRQESLKNLGKDPKRVGEQVGIKPHEIKALLPLLTGVRSIQAGFGKFDGTLEEVLSDRKQTSPEVRLEQESQRQQIELALKVLSTREREILIKRYGLDGEPPLTLQKIAYKLKLCRERVRQIEKSALSRLTHGQIGRDLKKLSDEIAS